MRTFTTFSIPVAKGHGRVPAYINDRVIRRALRIFVAVPVLEVVAVMKSCSDTPFRPLRILVNELLELRVGDRVGVDTEQTHRYCVPWDFGREQIGASNAVQSLKARDVGSVGTHLEGTAVNEHHFRCSRNSHSSYRF